jgi:peroxiredoxin
MTRKTRRGPWGPKACIGLVVAGSITACLPHEKQYATTPGAELSKQAPDTGVAIGQSAPDATVQDDQGRQVTLSSYFGKGPVLLIFYRGGWCPPCNYQVHELSVHYPEFLRRGVQPVAISVDKPSESAKTKTEFAVPFPVLSDPDLAAHKAYRVVDHVGALTSAMLGVMGASLSNRSGRDHHDVAIPSMFLVDSRGVVRWGHTDPDYSQRPSLEQVFQIIDSSTPKSSSEPQRESTTHDLRQERW